jgi:hypothetical protein
MENGEWRIKNREQANKGSMNLKSKIFVFRISKGNEPGNPKGRCPLDYSEVLKEIKNLSQKQIKIIDYENNDHLGFVKNEFWNNNTLRQGWGIKNTDLTQDIKHWIENYMLSGKIFWGDDISCNSAKGRWNILRRLKDIRVNDIIIIPKSSREQLDDYYKYIICQAENEYYFDYPEHIQDFGHCLKVKNIKVYDYRYDTLLGSDFKAPYLWAVTEVKEYHSRYRKISEFLNNNYINSL